MTVLSMLDLPSLILVDILSRLPLTTLVHCRCVCQTFYDLTSDQYFSRVRFNKQPPMVMMASILLNKLKLSIITDPCEEYVRDIEDRYECIVGPSKEFVVFNNTSSINGFVVIIIEKYSSGRVDEWFYLHNPLLRDFVALPRLECQHPYFPRYELGYTPVSNRYKLVKMTASYERKEAKFAILTIGTSTWRQLPITAPFPLVDCRLFNFEGGLQWMYDESLYVFDLENEKIKCLSLPPHSDATSNDKELRVFGSSLSVIHNYSGDTNIWVMKDYRIKESWIKIRVSELNYKYVRESSTLHSSIEDLSSTESLIRKVVEKVQKLEMHSTFSFLVFDYVPSFVRSKDILKNKDTRSTNVIQLVNSSLC